MSGLRSPHDSLAIDQVAARACSSSADMQTGWTIKRETKGSHRVLSRPGWADYIFGFHGRDEIGPRMLNRIAKRTGLKPEDL